MLLCSFLCGIGLGAAYDVLRLLRIMSATEPRDVNIGRRQERKVLMTDEKKELPLPCFLRIYGKSIRPIGFMNAPKSSSLRAILNHLLIFFEDIAFFVLSGVAISLVLYYTNDGQLRFLSPICALIGFVIYYKTVGRLTERVERVAAFVIRSGLTYLLLTLLLPFVLLFKGIRLAASATVGKILHRIRQAEERRISERIKKSILCDAEKCFLPDGCV